MEKLLTVSIAAYNVAEYIRTALDSLILDREHLDMLDIIVVNDGSTDDTVELVRPYAAKYPDSIRLIDKENGGYGSTVNAALDAAEGRYFRLLDGDDWYDKRELTAFLDYIRETDADMILAPYRQVYESAGGENKTEKVLCEIDWNCPAMHSVTVRTEALRAVGDRLTEKCLYTDMEYTFDCIRASAKIIRYAGPVYCYRLGRGGQSVSLASIRKRYRDHMKVAEKLAAAWQSVCDDPEGYTDQQLTMLGSKTEAIIHDAYQAMFLQERPDRKEAVEFDAMLRDKYPAAYERSDMSGKVKLARKLRFRCYKLYCRYIVKVFLKQNPHSA